MTMKTYWDVPRDERHALTEEQVEHFVKIERAEQGCYVPDEPTPPPEPDPLDLERVTVYRLRVKEAGRDYSWSETSIDFRTREAAEAAGRAAVRVRTNSGQDVIEPHRVEVDERTVVTAASYAEHAAEMERQEGLKTEYENEKKRWAEAVAKAQEAGTGIWDDYRAAQAQERDLEAIRKAHAQHLELAEGSESVALRFTVRAFGVDPTAIALGLDPAALRQHTRPKDEAETCDPF